MSITQWIGIGLAGIGLLFMVIGIFGLYIYDNFYIKATVSSLIDSVGFIIVGFGVMVYMGLSLFSSKTLILIVLILLLNPLANHYIVRGAYRSGYRPEKER